MTFQVSTKGPVFTGVLQAAVTAAVLDGAFIAAQEGVNMVTRRLGSVLQNPTGFYESQIQTNRVAKSTLITDGGTVYGPWLEGTPKRNAASRFKGYKTFRQTKRELQGKAPLLASPRVYGKVRQVTS